MPRTRSFAPARPTPAMAKSSTSAAIGPISHRDLSALLVEIAGTGSVTYIDWPPDKKAIDIGSFYADSVEDSARDGLDPGSVSSPTGSARPSHSIGSTTIDTCLPSPRTRGRWCDVPRVPFLSLVPHEDAADVRAAIDRVVARGWFILGSGSRRVRNGVRSTRMGARLRGRRRHWNRCHRPDPARPRHRTGRRSHHDAAVGRLFGAGRHDGRRPPRVLRHRSRAADPRPARASRPPSPRAHARSFRSICTASRPT